MAGEDSQRGDDHYLRSIANKPLAGRVPASVQRLRDDLISVVALLPGFGIIIAMAINDPDFDNRGSSGSDLELFTGLPVFGLLAMGLGFAAYAAIQAFFLTRDAQSLGKKMVGLRIVRQDDGGKPGFVSVVLLRECVPILIGFVPFIGRFFGLVDVLCIFGEERLCIHDRFARTRVVDA